MIRYLFIAGLSFFVSWLYAQDEPPSNPFSLHMGFNYGKDYILDARVFDREAVISYQRKLFLHTGSSETFIAYNFLSNLPIGLSTGISFNYRQQWMIPFELSVASSAIWGNSDVIVFYVRPNLNLFPKTGTSSYASITDFIKNESTLKFGIKIKVF